MKPLILIAPRLATGRGQSREPVGLAHVPSVPSGPSLPEASRGKVSAPVKRARQWPASLVLGAALLALELLAALLASWAYPADPFELAGSPFTAPFADAAFPLGTDMMGRDIAAGLVHGTRVSLLVAFSAMAVAVVLGTLVGLLAGFKGGWLDHALMRLTEVFQIIPHFLLAIVLVVILGTTLHNIVLAIAMSSWTMVARLVRAETIALRERDHVQIAIAMGASDARVVASHVFPALLPTIASSTSVLTSVALLTESGLAFLGLGDRNYITWGGMVAAAREALLEAPYMTLLPGAAMVISVVAVSLIGDGIGKLGRRGRE